MEDCIFCKIVREEIPCHKIYEDDNSLAFLDIKPHAKGHTVFIPKKHGETAFDFTENDLSEFFPAVRKVMEILKEKLNPDGFNVGWNNGSTAGQVVPHLHIHIFPRYEGDGGGSMHSMINNPQIDVEEVAKLFNTWT